LTIVSGDGAMKTEHFNGELLSGHKQAAVELPFDPAERWQRRALPMRGRRGHPVIGTLNGTPFESSVVSRSRRNFVLIEDELRQTIGATIGDIVSVTLQPPISTP